MPRSAQLALLACLALQALSAQAAAPRPTPETRREKLDAGLGKDHGPLPVFVRFESQWLGDAKAYAAECRRQASLPRRAERKRAIARLKQLAAASEQAFRPRLGALPGLSQVRHYWLVNGFACLADAAACRALAAEPSVSFVYKKPARVPALQRRPARGGRSSLRLRRRVPAILESLRKPEPDPEPDSWQYSFNLQRIQAPAAWRSGALGQGVVVALLDSGLLPTPALSRALWHKPSELLNGKDDDGDGLVDDLFGYDFGRGLGLSIGDSGRCHGSMCGGIIAGRPVQVDGKPFVTGVAPRARLMVLRGMGQLRAYEYALENGADLLSMSYMYVNIELGNWRGLYRLAHEHLTAAGLVSVGGSGNFAQRAPAGKQICLPKDIPCVISASGLNRRDQLPAFSSLGPCTWQDVVFYRDHGPKSPLLKPDVTAFSMDFPVWSALRAWPPRGQRVRQLHDAGDGSGLIIGARGNSFAGPHAAGVAALMFSANPDLPAFMVKELMERSCKDLGEPGKDHKFGAGLLNAAKAVDLARAQAEARRKR